MWIWTLSTNLLWQHGGNPSRSGEGKINTQKEAEGARLTSSKALDPAGNGAKAAHETSCPLEQLMNPHPLPSFCAAASLRRIVTQRIPTSTNSINSLIQSSNVYWASIIYQALSYILDCKSKQVDFDPCPQRAYWFVEEAEWNNSMINYFI